MIIVKLREAMDEYQQRTGERLTYKKLAARAGVSRATVESLASRPSYNPSLSVIGRICQALGCSPGQLLELHENEPPPPRGND